MLLTTLCANAPAISADAAARTRVSAYVAFAFVMPSTGSPLHEGNTKDGDGLWRVRSFG
jgi:hypothetical protein